MTIPINAELAALITAATSLIYAFVSAISLWLLSRQISDARRFGAAPTLYALLKELEDHMAAVRRLGHKGVDDAGHAKQGVADARARETIDRCLEFFERMEHLRSAGVLPATVLRGAFGPALRVYLADPRFAALIAQDTEKYAEVGMLAKHIAQR